MRRIEELEGEFLSLWEDMAEARGFDRALGRIICILLLEARSLSQREISEATGYSVPTVSKALNTLTSLGSVRKARKPRARTTLYYVEMHPLEMLSGAVAKWMLIAEIMGRRVAEIQRKMEEVRGEDVERAQRLARRLTELASSLPRMLEVMERAMNELRRLTASGQGPMEQEGDAVKP